MPPRPHPELMVIGDSLPQGCRSLSVTADFCAKSWPARFAAQNGWEFVTPDFPRPVLFDLESDIRLQLNPLALIQHHQFPGFIGRFRQNLAAWVQNNKESQFDCFDNIAVAGDRIYDLYKQTAANSQEVIDARMASGDVLKELSNNGIADLHIAINARFTLNPSQDPQFANFTQLDWVRARLPKRLIIEIGHNHGLYQIGSDAVIPSTGVTGGNDGEGGYYDQWAELAKQVAELPADIELVLICLLPKVSAVSNLMPMGIERANGYAVSYEPIFSIEPNSLSGTDLAVADQNVRDANTQIEQIVRAAAAAKGTEGRLKFISVYDLFEQHDFKNSQDTGRRITIPDRPTIDNLYLKRNSPLGRQLVAGGFESVDGMHASGAGYALLASKILTALGINHDENAILQTAFDEDLELTTRSMNLNLLITILTLIRHHQIDLGLNLTSLSSAVDRDTLPITKIIQMAKAVFTR